MDVFRASKKKKKKKKLYDVIWDVKQISDIQISWGGSSSPFGESKKIRPKTWPSPQLQVWTTSHATSAKSQVCETTRAL